MNRRPIELPFVEVNQISTEMKRIDPPPIAFLLVLLPEPDGKRRDVGRIIAESQRRGVALDAEVIEKLFGQRVRYAANGGASFLMFLHFGYAEQPRNSPKRPRRFTIGEPHFSHFSSVMTGSSLGGGGGALSFKLSGNGFALRHLGYPEHARNGPRRLLRISIGEPHFSHLM